ncbi:MAG: YceI family protein [Planctomycetes bacterium]|nr:YceI family protein [Planctomycetota bacterium]
MRIHRRARNLIRIAAVLTLARGRASAEAEAGILYRVDAERSAVSFVLQATGHKVRGQTKALRGEFRLPRTWDTESLAVSARVEIDAASLDTGSRKRDAKMHGETLDVEQYPAIAFEVERVKGPLGRLAGGSEIAVSLEGKLTIRGITRPVSIPAQLALKAGEVRVRGEYTLTWTDYGVPDPSVFVLRVSKDMTVLFFVVASPAADAAPSSIL